MLRENFGWLAPEYNLMSWALSSLQLKKFYKNITLYADSNSAKMLIDTLQLPYTNVICELDALQNYHPELWAIPKVYAYSKQESPFLHVDGDVYIWKAFSNELMNSGLIAQNMEAATVYYETKLKELETFLKYFPIEIVEERKSKNPVYAYNAGIFGGHDIEFFKKYTSKAFEFVNRNSGAFTNITVTDFNIFFEQYLFYCMVKTENKKVNVLFNKVIGDNEYTGLGDFAEVPYNKQYLHLLGVYKRNAVVCQQLADRLRLDYPEYYYKIISLYKRNLAPLQRDYYYNCRCIDEKSLVQRYRDLKSKNQLSFQKSCDAREGFKSISFKPEIATIEEHISFARDKHFLNFTTDLVYARDIYTTECFQYLFEDIAAIESKTLFLNFWVVIENIPTRMLIQFFSENDIIKFIDPDLDYLLAIIPECDTNLFSLLIIDRLDYLMLKKIMPGITIGDLLEKLKEHFDEDDLNDSMDEYRRLIFGRIKMAIVNKLVTCKKYDLE